MDYQRIPNHFIVIYLSGTIAIRRALNESIPVWYVFSKLMALRPTLRLFVTAGEAALLLTVLCFAVALIAGKSFMTLASSAAGKALVVGLGLLLPIAVVSWWTFRRLLRYYSRPEARAAAITFGFFTPVPLAMGLLLGPILGGYTAKLFGDRFAFAGAVASLVLIITLISFIASAFAIWLVRRSPPVGYPSPPSD
jgi:hypothetical protein